MLVNCFSSYYYYFINIFLDVVHIVGFTKLHEIVFCLDVAVCFRPQLIIHSRLSCIVCLFLAVVFSRFPVIGIKQTRFLFYRPQLCINIIYSLLCFLISFPEQCERPDFTSLFIFQPPQVASHKVRVIHSYQIGAITHVCFLHL